MENVKIMVQSDIKRLKLFKYITIILILCCFYLLYSNIQLRNNIISKNNTISELITHADTNNRINKQTIDTLSNIIINQKEENKEINKMIIRERFDNIIYNPTFQISAFMYRNYPNINKNDKNEIINAFTNHSNENVPLLLTASICQRESNFIKTAKGKILPSGARAKGLCQIHPTFWMDKIVEIGYSEENDLFIPDANIYASIQAFKHFYNRKDNVFDALYGYVGGDHHTYVVDVISKYIDTIIWLESLSETEINQILIWANS